MKLLPDCKKLAFLMMIIGNLEYGYSQQSLVWNVLQLPVQLTPQWQLPLDFSYRTIGVSTASYQNTFRTGVRRFINEQWSVAAGLAFFFTRISFNKADHEFGKEFRLWQEVAREWMISKKNGIVNRFRIEERFFDATSKSGAYNSLRFRYRAGLSRLITEKLKLQLSDEYMEQLTAGKFSFQQNRLNVSCAYLFNPYTQLQFGYIWSELKAAAQHIITLSFQKTILLYGNRNK